MSDQRQTRPAWRTGPADRRFVATVSQRIGGTDRTPCGYRRPLVEPGAGRAAHGTLAIWRLWCPAALPPQPAEAVKTCATPTSPALPGPRPVQGNTPLPGLRRLRDAGISGAHRYFLELERILTRLLGAQGSATSVPNSRRCPRRSRRQRRAARGLFLIARLAQFRTVPTRPWDGMMLAASPCVSAAALLNWDCWRCALTSLRDVAWSRRGPTGRGAAGAGHRRQALPALPARAHSSCSACAPAAGRLLHHASTCVVVWGLVNIPVLWLAPTLAELLAVQLPTRRGLRLDLVCLRPGRNRCRSST